MSLEQDRFNFEKQKFEKTEGREEAKLRAEISFRKWSLLATLIPIAVLIVGILGNIYLENIKQKNAADLARQKIKREFIDRQLADLYYPIQMRLEKDGAVWELAEQLSKKNASTTNEDFSRYIENSVILPNHDEVLSIVSKNFGLIKNADEKYDPRPLMNIINQYQRHVAAYKTLRALHIYSLNPISVCKGCEWPQEFGKEVSSRIASLEAQREELATH